MRTKHLRLALGLIISALLMASLSGCKREKTADITVLTQYRYTNELPVDITVTCHERFLYEDRWQLVDEDYTIKSGETFVQEYNIGGWAISLIIFRAESLDIKFGDTKEISYLWSDTKNLSPLKEKNYRISDGDRGVKIYDFSFTQAMMDMASVIEPE